MPAMRLSFLIGTFLLLAIIVGTTSLGLSQGWINAGSLQSISLIMALTSMIGMFGCISAIILLRRNFSRMAAQNELSIRKMAAQMEAANRETVQSLGLLETALKHLRGTGQHHVAHGDGAGDRMPVTPALSLVKDGANSPANISAVSFMAKRANHDLRDLERIVNIARSAMAPMPISLQAMLEFDTEEVRAYLAHLRLANRDVCLDQLQGCNEIGAEASLLSIGRCLGIIRDHFKSVGKVRILCPVHFALFEDRERFASLVNLFDRSAELKKALVLVLPEFNGEQLGRNRKQIQDLNHAGIALAMRMGDHKPASWLEKIVCFRLMAPDVFRSLATGKHGRQIVPSARDVVLEAKPSDIEGLSARDAVFITDSSIAPAKLVKSLRRSAARAS